ncbi:hypothetical protein NPIL_355121 [Nephila pilipes]|uniref:Uncharacterized protein n=1 Tax=Nephila pilipes TaxID=299642 RepID=A0A8X6NCW1_NEPPI|nr:hypothetical protein NPIL_355121 [Nephila pilipes]
MSDLRVARRKLRTKSHSGNGADGGLGSDHAPGGGCSDLDDQTVAFDGQDKALICRNLGNLCIVYSNYDGSMDCARVESIQKK